MKITVIGGSGFLGSHVADLLTESGHDVIIYDKKESNWKNQKQKIILGDILEIENLEKALSKSEIVYNFAAFSDIDETIHKPIETSKVNIIGTLNALELCKKYSIKRFILASTIYVYSTHFGNFYKCSKKSAENFVEEYNRLFDLNYTILRYGSLYGPRSDSKNGLYKIIKSAIENEEINYVGNIEARREYIHVRDAASASVKILENEFKNQNVILSGQESFRVYDVMKMVSEILGKKHKLNFSDKKKGGHYLRSAYSYQPRIAKKYTPNFYYDMGQGILQMIGEIKEIKN